MREIGIKDRNYYYKSIRNLRGRVDLFRPVDVDALKRAVREALSIYPHFAVRPVVRDGKFFYEDNNSEIPVIPDDGTARYLGSDETNGYLFYLSYGDDYYQISSFHGLADHGGFTPFFMNIIYYYVTECGGVVPDIRTYESDTDEMDAFYPYEKYADAGMGPVWEYTDTSPVFVCPEDENFKPDSPAKNYSLHISTNHFIDLTHKWETSFVPAMVSLITGAIADVYDVKEETIVACTTVNMRSVFESKNQTNFSEVIVMPMNTGLRTQNRKSQCRELRTFIDLQKTKANLARDMAALISAMKKLEGVPDPNPCVNLLPVPTYLLTYPGRVDFPVGYEEWIRGLNFSAAAENIGRGLAVMVKTTGDDMQFNISGAIDVGPICRKVTDDLSELGFDPRLEYIGETKCDLYSIDKLKKV